MAESEKQCVQLCPHDHAPLARVLQDGGISWRCRECGGIFATLPFLRRFLATSAINSLWQRARAADGTSDGIACPSCGSPMVRLKATADAASPLLDVCRICQSVWFDMDEFEALPSRPPDPKPATTTSIPPEMRAKIAIFEVRRLSELERRERAKQFGSWQSFLALLGFPAPIGGPRVSRFPLITCALAGIAISASVPGFFDHSLILRFGLVPDTLFGNRFYTLVTSLFFHGNVLHLIGNLYFLFLFGPLAEGALGRKRFLLLFVVAGISGGLLHAAIDLRASLPVIGASGCISGLMTYVAFAFPSLSLGVCFYFHFAAVPVELYVVFWFVLQIMGLFPQIFGFGDVSAAAHIAGAVAGAAIFFLCGKPSRDPSRSLDID